MMRPNQVEATLLYNSPIWLVANAVRICANSEEDMDTPEGHDSLYEKDSKLISRRILRRGEDYNPLFPAHESTLEHAVYTFELEFSRGLLQEISRHRIASPSVQSSRYALKKLVKKMDMNHLEQYLTLTGDEEVDEQNKRQLEFLIDQVKQGKPNDVTKYLIPDSLRTREIFTINARSLRNFFRLRTSRHALWEFRQLAFAMYDALPEGHRVLFEDRIHKRPEWCRINGRTT